MSLAKFHNVGALIAAVDTGVIFNAVAGAAPDSAEQAGAIIDRTAHGSAQSASLMIPYAATLATGKTLSIGYRVEHGEDAALADTSDLAKVLPAAGTVVNAPAGGGTVRGVVKIDFDLGRAKRYLRVNLTTDLSATATDTSVAAAVLVLGGEDREPAI